MHESIRSELEIINTLYIHDIIKRSEYAPSLLGSIRSELEIMNMLYIHDIIKRSEYAPSLHGSIRSELEIMNMLYIHDIINVVSMDKACLWTCERSEDQDYAFYT